MKLLIALLLPLLMVGTANASTVDISKATTRSATVTTSNPTFFQLDTKLPTIVDISGTGTATLKVSSIYVPSPTTFTGFIPDPNGSVTGNTAWQFPAGLSFTGLDVSSGIWTVRVTQPK